ncbi:MAG TPA: discoidin domain-containing protein [Streptosporangiaceae bacterium]|nr:discoidin domain-containing protein [Streptosporangiaceae bacterium]
MAGSALAAVSASEVLSALTSPASAASPVGDVVGKITVGYQGWFACSGDGAPINGWWHWSQNMSQPPSPSNSGIKAWPDMREYTRGYQTAFANLGNGQPATLFSSYDQQTVDTHFRWMQGNGCDTAALQRFNPTGGEGPTRDAMAGKVRSSAETYARKFYVMYDVSGWTNMQSEIKTDWTSKMSALTASTAYARQNGKPVVGIWGFGFNDANHPWSASACLDVVNWFKSQGCYVMGGVPTYWRTGINDSRPGYLDVYHAFNMISPWMVGRIGTAADSDWFYTNVNLADQADCNANGLDYQPCVLPGDLSARQRVHGDFMWRQFYNMVRVGAQGLYISMFDEYNEGNQIAETAPNSGMVPAGSGLLALDEDGTVCSSDYYLRITADGGKMLKGQIALTATRPTQPVVSGSTTNVALNRPATASTSVSGYAPSQATDGNSSSYWESTNNAFPQWLQVDLGTTLPLGTVVIKLPPSTSWGARTQTLSVLGGTDGTNFSTITPSASYTFDPNTNANSTTITFASTSARYVRLNFTANSGWPAGQVGELEVYTSASTTSAANLSLSPSSLTFASQNVGTTSAAQVVTVTNTGNAPASISSIAASGEFAQTNNCGASLAAGANCTINVTFTPTAVGTRTGYVTINSNATNSPGTISLSGTGAGSTTNLALGKTMTASGSVSGYPSSNANDNNTSSYWESTNNAFPQWLQVDLGASTTVAKITLTLPPSTSWGTRTQTLSVLGSSDGTTFTTIVPSAGYTFDPTKGNTATITFTSTSTRYLRLNLTANTAWPAGQVSEFQVYAV